MFTPNDYMKIKQYRKNIVCTEEEKAIVCNIKRIQKSLMLTTFLGHNRIKNFT